ncbi:hypothetical protein [Pedobacter sp. SL55]|uniref:hypothetical protein n=1 Tax=Pedobacter sp. SL55 TaxID=2995161 RepID=UPI00226EF3F0|nr:hypothetical protein [Pedobacter sp. SL55]WAC39352.1 hypothetical protein OVA16_12125 [Pedobacter sp. SL55]
MFRYTHNNKKFSFYFLDSYGKKISVSNWAELQSEFLSQLAILSELRDNGLAGYTENSCEVENIDILKLSDIDKQILELPNSYQYEILVESDGTLKHNSFKFKYGFYDFAPNGTRLKVSRNGAIIKIEETEYLLSENQYLLCEAIEEFNSLPEIEKGNVTNLKKLSELKTLSKESGLTLEQFLSNQELFIPEKIKIDIDFKDGILEVFPQIPISNPHSFINNFDLVKNKVKEFYAVSEEQGKTTRVFIYSDTESK